MVEKQHGKGGTRQSTCQNAVTSLGWDDVLRKKPLPPRFALEISQVLHVSPKHCTL
jgi:hypothetical protein